jgi:hypothetical protein
MNIQNNISEAVTGKTVVFSNQELQVLADRIAFIQDTEKAIMTTPRKELTCEVDGDVITKAILGTFEVGDVLHIGAITKESKTAFEERKERFSNVNSQHKVVNFFYKEEDAVADIARAKEARAELLK